MASKDERINSLKAACLKNPESESYHELCELLAEDKERRGEAREVCFKALTAAPGDVVGRLALARLFYLDGYYEFCIRELVEVYARSEAPAVKKLLDAFGAHAARFLTAKTAVTRPPSDAAAAKVEAGDEVVAEIDIDDEFLEAIDGLK